MSSGDNQKYSVVYMEMSDSTVIKIKNRSLADLKHLSEKFNSESDTSKLISQKIETLTEEKRTQVEAAFIKSLTEYITLADYDMPTFILILESFKEKDKEKIGDEFDVRVRTLGNERYVAEFWEDGLAVNSEANALAWAQKLTMRYPDDTGLVETVKETYANARNSITSGEKERYTRTMVLIYKLNNDGSISFLDPFQPMLDLISQ